jgi:predicted proteasome-type protease
LSSAKKQRFISKFPFTVSYNRLNAIRQTSKYKSFLEIGVRNFIKACVASELNYGLRGDEFVSYSDIIAFINDLKSNKAVKVPIKVTKQSISNLKNRKLI